MRPKTIMTEALIVGQTSTDGILKRKLTSSELVVLTFGKLHTGSILELFVHVLDLILIYGDLRRLENRGLNKGQSGVTIIIKRCVNYLNPYIEMRRALT